MLEHISIGMSIDVTGVGGIESLTKILNQIVGVFDANGKAHQLIGDADLQALLTGQLEMRMVPECDRLD